MKYFTLKKTIALSFAFVFAMSVNAQDKSKSSNTPKIFGGSSQYRTWTFGFNGGFTVPSVVIGGTNDFGKNVGLGEYTFGEYYGLSLRKQITHTFGIQGNLNRGHVISYNENSGTGINGGAGIYSSAKTEVQYDLNLSGVINIATIDFLHRENTANFYLTAGYGVLAYNPIVYNTYGAALKSVNFKGQRGDNGDKEYVKEAYLPLGLGFKFKLNNNVALDLGYEMKFVDGDNFDGVKGNGVSRDKFSYTHAGLEFSLGSKAKKDLNWVNPIALMYDELKDSTLRKEIDALKSRVTTAEQAVEALKKDSDGDGVADHLDKCTNTPAGATVDGSGCELDTDADGVADWKDKCPTEAGTVELNGCPEAKVATLEGVKNIQFEYNSSVLKTASYEVLDQVSATLRAQKELKLQLDGHASQEGSAAYNVQLSLDRANAVKTYLVNSGVAADRIAVNGYGESRPIQSNATKAGREANRRVEFSQQ
jgi:OOP family OmpA-OmpF porin